MPLGCLLTTRKETLSGVLDILKALPKRGRNEGRHPQSGSIVCPRDAVEDFGNAGNGLANCALRFYRAARRVHFDQVEALLNGEIIFLWPQR